jgi:hypothetical protein
LRAGFYSRLIAAELIAAQARSRLESIDELILGSPLERADGHGPAYQHLVGKLMEQFSVPRLENAWDRLPNVKIGRALKQALSDLTAAPPPQPSDDKPEPTLQETWRKLSAPAPASSRSAHGTRREETEARSLFRSVTASASLRDAFGGHGQTSSGNPRDWDLGP